MSYPEIEDCKKCGYEIADPVCAKHHPDRSVDICWFCDEGEYTIHGVCVFCFVYDGVVSIPDLCDVRYREAEGVIKRLIEIGKSARRLGFPRPESNDSKLWKASYFTQIGWDLAA